jgi:L-cysteate sulfo-lyase
MNNLQEVLGGPRLFVKRDDCTGLGLGGNKIRKLEFLMGEALERKADTVITTGGVQSNHARQTAAAAKKLGMEAILLLRGEEPEETRGNLLLDRILGAEVRFVEASDFLEVDRAAYELGSQLEASGKRPYVIPLGGSTPTGSLGYAAAALEIAGQIQEMGIRVDTVVLANGSAGTQAGLALGFKALHSEIRVIGISVSRSRDVLSAQVLDLGNRTAEKLGVDTRLDPEDAVVYPDYVGAGYAIPTQEGVEAIPGPGLYEQSDGGLDRPDRKGRPDQGAKCAFSAHGRKPGIVRG